MLRLTGNWDLSTNASRISKKRLATMTEAIRLDPKDAKAYNGRGYCYFRKGDKVTAMADYNEAIRLKPTFALAYVNRGNIFDANRDSERPAPI